MTWIVSIYYIYTHPYFNSFLSVYCCCYFILNKLVCLKDNISLLSLSLDCGCVDLLYSELAVPVRVPRHPHDQVDQGVLLAVGAKAQDRAQGSAQLCLQNMQLLLTCLL